MNESRQRPNSHDWYEPLESAFASAEKQAVKERRGWTPGRVILALGCLLLLIMGSSLGFSRGAGEAELPPITAPFQREETTPQPQKTPRPAQTPSSEDGEDSGDIDDMPSNRVDFFANYYEKTQTDAADIRIERVKLPIEFELTLEAPGAEELSLQALYADWADSIVGVTAYQKGQVGYFWGTGVILSEDGLILTNTHIINDTDRAVVTLSDNREYSAKLVGGDALSDLAVLKIDAEGLRPAVFGRSEQLVVGQSVAAIGNPLGEELRSTLTNGIISAIDRDVSYEGRTMTLLQTNAALNEGNSGGALFNMYGQVIGITNMKMMSSLSSIEGIGFAIPSSTVQRVVHALVRDGEVRGRPAIGITVGGIPEEAMERYNLPEGLYISDVSRNSDADKQGVRIGDVLTAVDGIPVKTTAEVNDIKNTHAVGDTMTLTLWRDGEELVIVITLGDTNDIYR